MKATYFYCPALSLPLSDGTCGQRGVITMIMIIIIIIIGNSRGASRKVPNWLAGCQVGCPTSRRPQSITEDHAVTPRTPVKAEMLSHASRDALVMTGFKLVTVTLLGGRFFSTGFTVRLFIKIIMPTAKRRRRERCDGERAATRSRADLAAGRIDSPRGIFRSSGMGWSADRGFSG